MREKEEKQNKGTDRRSPLFCCRVWTLALSMAAILFLTGCGMSEAERWQEQYDLGVQYLEELDYEQAVVAFTAAIEIDESQAAAYIGRAEAYLEGDVQTASAEGLRSALSDYDTALSLDDSEADTYVGRGEVYLALGEEEEYLKAALADFTAALALDGTRIDLYLQIGAINTALGDYSGAASACTLAIENGVQTAEAYTAAARAYVALGDYESAADLAEEGLGIHPDNEELQGLAEEIAALIEQKEEEERIAALKQEIEDRWWDELMRFVALLQEDADGITREEWLDDELYSYLEDELEDELIWELEDGQYLGLHPYGLIYYGMMENGERSGWGIWTGANVDWELYDFYLTVYEGPWSGNLPNGTGTYSIMAYTKAGMGAPYETVFEYYSIGFVDGLADGSGTAKVEIDGEETDETYYHIEAENGDLKLLYTDLNGEERSLVVTMEDGYHWWWSTRTKLGMNFADSETEEE